MEAQNRKLATDLDFLRNRWGRDAANVRDMYEADLLQARKLIDETGQQRDDLKKKARAMAEEMAQLRRKLVDFRNLHFLPNFAGMTTHCVPMTKTRNAWKSCF